MAIPLAFLAALPWRKIGIGIAGALIVAFLVWPWVGWSSARKDRAKAVAEKELAIRDLEISEANERQAIANREAIQAVADDLRTSFDSMALDREELGRVIAVAERGAREIAAARNELESLAISHESLVARAEDKTVCETFELVLRDLAEAGQ